MNQGNFLPFVLFFLATMSLAPVYKKKAGESDTIRKIAVIWPWVPVTFVAVISLVWGMHTLRVWEKADRDLMFIGTSAQGNPYIVDNQTVDSPTFFAFARFIVYGLGDGTKDTYERLIDTANYLFLVVMVAAIGLAVISHIKKEGPPSSLSVSCFLCICLIGVLPLTRNIELANTNIWPAGLGAIFLLSIYLSEKKWTDFLGGMALGLAFMIKPYLFLVLVFFFFSEWRRKSYYGIGGIVTAGILGFCGSLMVQGIDIDAYYTFLTKVPKLLTGEEYHYQRSHLNLSMIQYVPFSIKRLVSTLAVLGFGLVAFFSSKNSGKKDIVPWFFVANISLPLLWYEHLMGIFPAFLFFLLNKKEWEQVLTCMAVVTLVFFASITKIPVLVSALLLGLWLWRILPSFQKKEHLPFQPELTGS